MLGVKPVFPEKLTMRTSVGFRSPGILFLLSHPLCSFFILAMDSSKLPLTLLHPWPPGPQAASINLFLPQIQIGASWNRVEMPWEQDQVSCCWRPGAHQFAVLPLELFQNPLSNTLPLSLLKVGFCFLLENKYPMSNSLYFAINTDKNENFFFFFFF